jgi:hypothetical protein
MPGKYLKGAFVQMMPTFLRPLPNVVIFQFNPETITHSWHSAAPLVTHAKDRPNPLAVRNLPAESFSFTLAMDSNDMIADGSPVALGLATGTGIYSRLAALEMLLYPTGEVKASKLEKLVSSAIDAASKGANSSSAAKVPQLVMPTVLFVWGPGRILPVRINSLTITERLYDSLLLNPTHAEAQVALDVLTPDEVTALKDSLKAVASVAYTFSQTFRQTMALANLANAGESIIGMLPL